MQCQVCNKNEATIHLTEISEGLRTEMHLCEQCALEQGVTIQNQMPINELLSNLLASQPSDEEIAGGLDTKAVCPDCGFTLDNLRKESVMGCPNDYVLFEKSLAPLIQKAHNGKTVHCGKVPSTLSDDTKSKVQLENLRQQLESAVQTENYELAAELRDKIQELEK